jgi:hypothetical protein
VPERAWEASRLSLSSEYRRHLRELFKGLLALTRETHIKQLEMAMVGCALRQGRNRICIEPGLSIEPLATYYLRRALSYVFVQDVLEQCFGPTWQDLKLVNEEGGDGAKLGHALTEMENIFFGAHLAVCGELGMAPETSAFSSRQPQQDLSGFAAWKAAVDTDGDLSHDTRMMVPVFFDIERGKTKAWVLLGWSERPITIGFHQRPKVISVERKGIKAVLGRTVFKALRPEVEFETQYVRAAFPVTAEIYVDHILDRNEFRRLCDHNGTRSAILQALNLPKAQ